MSLREYLFRKVPKKTSKSREPDEKGSSEWGSTTFPEDETENYIFRAEEMETTLDKRGLASG